MLGFKLVGMFLKETNISHVAVRLFSKRSQMISNFEKNKTVVHEAQCSYHILMRSMIYDYTDAQKHGIYMFYT